MSLNINDFNIPELFDFLEINEKTPSFTIVKNKIDGLKEKVSNNTELLNFLNKAEQKIKNYYENQNNKIEYLGNKSFTINNLQYNNYKQEREESKSDSGDENNNEESDNEESDSEESDTQKSDIKENNIQHDNIKNINDPKLLKLLNSSETKLLEKDLILNINTLNRILTTPIIGPTEMNVINLDSGHSFFKLPTVLKNITEIKLIDIEIKYDSLSIISDYRNNNTFTISSEYISNYYNNLDISKNTIEIVLKPSLNTRESLIIEINKWFDYSYNKEIDLSFIKFDICYNYSLFKFSKFYDGIPGNSATTFEFIFPNTNYNLASVLGFAQVHGNNTLYIDKNTISSLFYNASDNSYVLQSTSIVDYTLDHLYFALNENVQNSQNNNLLLVSENQLSRYKVLSKLNLSYPNNYSQNGGNGGIYILKNSDIIKDYNNTRKYDGPIDINNFYINIIDDFDNKIFLNYKNFSFSLLFKSTYNYIKDFKNINY